METKELIEATCPDCRGPLSQIQHDEGVLEYQCLVGHAYSARALLAAHADAQEKALWAAALALEEAANIVRAVSPELPPGLAERLQRQVQVKLGQAAEIKNILERLEPFETE
jgi:two-component system chemotaxis response regulator CheB